VAGQVKAGLGTLIGNAGEHYVMAELLKRGIVAALAPRNAPDFDILAARGRKTIRIRVKTKSEGYDIWQWSLKKEGVVFRNVAPKGDFVVLVHLAAKTRDVRYYLARTRDVEAWLQKEEDDWLARLGRDGRPHSKENRIRHLHFSKSKPRLSSDWDLLWK
jgi:hypothetical protein